MDISTNNDRKAAYLDQAASWASDVHGSLRASRRVAWIIAGVAAAIALMEAVAIVALTPLKTVVPYTILVDRQTGYVETVRGLQPGALTQDASVTQSFIVQYVLARETFDAADLTENYRKVSLWTAPAARAQYQHSMQRSDPTSPLNLFAPTTQVAVTIKSVSQLSPTTALVRFDTTRTEAGATSGERRSYAAVLAFKYTGAPMTMGDRFINPLGFQVVSYRRDSETTASLAPSAAAVAQP
jgi:type IV secretion system protein VirB8